jgi:hypothetical protein
MVAALITNKAIFPSKNKSSADWTKDDLEQSLPGQEAFNVQHFFIFVPAPSHFGHARQDTPRYPLYGPPQEGSSPAGASFKTWLRRGSRRKSAYKARAAKPPTVLL